MYQPEIDIKEICRYFLLRGLSPGQQQAAEETYGYRGRCVRKLAELTNYSVGYVQKWGQGLEWNKMRPITRAHVTIVYLCALLRDKDAEIQALKQQLQEKETLLIRHKEAIRRLRVQAQRVA